MGINKISLPTAYMIETIRSNGVSNQELLAQIEKRDTSAWNDFNPKFNFNELIALAEEDPNVFKSIILDGYEVKFVTIRGIKTLLQLKFDKMEDRDYQSTEKGITGLKVNSHQLSAIKQLLSKNWMIQELSSGNNNESYQVIQIEL